MLIQRNHPAVLLYKMMKIRVKYCTMHILCIIMDIGSNMVAMVVGGHTFTNSGVL